MSPTTADGTLSALGASVGRLRARCEGLVDSQLEEQSYCSAWSIADVLSHIGSGAVIMQRTLDDALHGRPTPADFAPAVWDEWNAKSPQAQAHDALVTDKNLLGALESLSEGDRSRLSFPMGPLSLSFEQAAALRLNEHAFHTWDIDVVFDPGARLPEDAAAVVVDNLATIVRFAGKPTGDERDIRVHTTDPERHLIVRLTSEGVELVRDDTGAPADVELPAEAFGRLVYGRLDPEHSPESSSDREALDLLRQAFPGF